MTHPPAASGTDPLMHPHGRTPSDEDLAKYYWKKAPESSAGGSSNGLRWITFILHLLFVLIHIALLVVLLFKWEEEVHVSLGRSFGYISRTIVLASTVFITIYGAVLVFLTQRLSITQLLYEGQTLTVAHDAVSSWGGLGASLSTLRNQLKLPASIYGSILIAVYLGCIAVLHTTTSTLFAFSVANVSMPAILTTTLGVPVPDTDGSYLFSSSSLANYLVGSVPTPGLINSTIHDVVDNPGNATYAEVNATTFYADCGYLASAETIAVSNNANALANGPKTHWFVYSTTFPDGRAIGMKMPIIAPNVVGSYQTEEFSALETAPLGGVKPAETDKWDLVHPVPSYMFYSSYLFQDSDGNAPVVTMNPPVIPVDPISGTTEAVPSDRAAIGTLNQIQAIGCTISTLSTSSAALDPQTNLLKDPPTAEPSSRWMPFQDAFNGLKTYTNDSLHTQWPRIFLNAPRTPIPSSHYQLPVINGDDTTELIPQNMFNSLDLFILTKLNMTPNFFLSDASPQPPSDLKLHDLENAIACGVAAAYWATGHVPSVPLEASYGLTTNPLNSSSKGESKGMVNHLVGQLELSFAYVLAGLAASLVLLITSCLLIGMPWSGSSVHSDSVSSVGSGVPAKLFGKNFGLLQVLWLSKVRPEMANWLGHIEEPTVDNLRKAGMQETLAAGSKVSTPGV